MSMAVPMDFSVIDVKMELESLNCPHLSLIDDYYQHLDIASASGRIVSFMNDLVQLPLLELKANIVAQQDLHGYDHPWVGGANYNLFQVTPYGGTYNAGAGVDLKTASTPAMDYYMSYTATSADTIIDVTTAWKYRMFATAPLPAGTYTLYFYSDSDSVRGTSYITDGNLNTVSAIRNYASRGTYQAHQVTVTEGQRIAICIGANAVLKLTTNFQVNSGSTLTTPVIPFENICPISGWDEVNVYVRGINIWDEEWEIGSFSSSTGGKTSSNDYIRSKNMIRILPNTQYFSQFSNGTMNLVLFYDAEQNYLGYDYVMGIGNPSVFTTPSNAYYMNFRMSSTYGTTYNHNVSINYPSTDTAYHAYNGQTYTIDLDGTRYGGTLDVKTGVLTVKWYGADLGNQALNWGYDNSFNFFYYNTGSSLSILPKMKNASTNTFICSIYEFGGSNSADSAMANASTGAYRHGTYIYIKDTRFTDVNTFKTAMDGVILVYELDTPQVVQLTAQQVKMLVGENNVWSDVGEVEVTYYTTESGGMLGLSLGRSVEPQEVNRPDLDRLDGLTLGREPLVLEPIE